MNWIKNTFYKMVYLLIFSTLGYSLAAQTAVPYFGKIKWVSGFSKEIQGENISYFSAYPDFATIALLTRTTDGNKTIEWESAPLPKHIDGPYIYFSWVAAHSSGTSSGIRNFDLYVNDEKLLTFSTYPEHKFPIWSYAAHDSSRIVFQQTKRDGANDAHGLAYLRLPRSRVTLGKPVKFKVVGQNQNSNDWYMTFKYSFEENVEVIPTPFLLKNGKQSVAINALHFGKPQAIIVSINNNEQFSFVANEGLNKFYIPITPVQKTDSMLVKIFYDHKLFSQKRICLKPVEARTLYFIHHSHTDIGYSHLQPDVEKIHNKNIDDALRMIDDTKNYPIDAQFKWNIESLWAAENYFNQATDVQKEKFIKAVKSGSIGLSAMYANMLTGLSQPEEVFHYTDYATQLKNKYGLLINSAMTSDVPGIAWTTVTALANAGVRYLSSGPNFLSNDHPYLGDRVGNYVKTWGDKPVWWTSPGGAKKILLWTGAKGYSSWHGTAPGGIFDRGEKKIAAYLNELSVNKYPYDMVQWRYNIVSDNGPIDTSISRFVMEWNEKYTSPKIILSTTEKLFEDFEKKYGNNLPVVSGDLTPYWEDGALSTANEEGRNRVNSLKLSQLTTLQAMLKNNQINQSKMYEAWKNVLLFHEHTWGAYNSISQPDIPFVTEQWRIKKQFLIDGENQIQQLQDSLLNPYINDDSKLIVVLNTTSHKRSGPVTVHTTAKGNSVKDVAGHVYPVQQLSNGDLIFLAENIPAFGKQIFELSDRMTPSANACAITDTTLSNGNISVAWNVQDGSIYSLKNMTPFNYAGSFKNQGINSYWYVPGLNPEEAVTSPKTQFSIKENGPVLTTISLRSAAPGANYLERNISLFKGDDKVYIDNSIDKKSEREKESVHFGFPFNEALKNVHVDAGYGIIKYLDNQLPGSNMDYMYGRRWIDASDTLHGIQMLWLQAPLIEPNAMIDERKTISQTHKKWKDSGAITTTWFSYIMNNYWHTNYKADQEGLSKYTYLLRPHTTINNSELEQTAEDFSQPLIAFAIKDKSINNGSLFELSNTNISATAITPYEDDSMLVRVFNPEANAIQFNFIWHELNPEKIILKYGGDSYNPNALINIEGMDTIEIILAGIHYK